MKCPSCQFENPDTQNFCGKCGTKLEKVCPNCKENNPPEYGFCGECGHNLTQSSVPSPKELSFDEKIEKIQKYLPKVLTEKILSQREKIEGEHKQVTVMFCDLEGFTPLVEKLGPEEAYTIMDEVYEILIHKVHDYEGTVNEMTGDGIMALFGAPVALEDAPQRAIRSAYAIHREMTKYSEKIRQEKESISSLKMRVGIHTGPVVVGTLGNDLRVEFKAVGDTVNLASRMEDLAEPGATNVTEDTFKLTEGLFRYESLGEKKVKGKEQTVKTYRVIGPSTRRTRFDVSAERGLTPFVGRERELELLLDGLERAKAGRGQAFSIIAEAGVGKSRLSYEFRKVVENEDITFLEGKCLSYSQGVAYHPIIDLYKSNFDIRDNYSDEQIKKKIMEGLKLLDVDEASVLPYLLALLSVEESGIDQIPLSPEGKKDRLIETMIRIPLKGSEIRPLVMIIEDLHWMDKSSEDVLKYLLESISGANILLIFTYRPEFIHTWAGKSYHNQLNLNRLSNRESLVMVNNLLGAKDIENDLENLILEMTEGVPFFIEEFLKSFKDLKIIERKRNRYHLIKDARGLEIPSTIQDVIMARVDSLPEGTKEILQIGSVIEREFSYDLIKQVTGLSQDKLLSHLSVLKDSELVYERGIYPQSTYIFKHALTQEVVYNSILTSRKKRLHVEIGDAIEELYRDNLGVYYGALAEHYDTGENYGKCYVYCRLAEGKAMIAGAHTDAITYNEKRVTCIEKLPRTSEVVKKIISARTALGVRYATMNYFIKAKEAVDPIVELALDHGLKRIIAQIYTIIGTHSLFVEEELAKAFKYLKESSSILEEISDRLLPTTILWMAISLSWKCEFENALYHFENALRVHTAADDLTGISITKSHIALLSYDWQGEIELGYKISDEALRIAEDCDDIFAKVYSYTFHGQSCYYNNFLDEAKGYFLKGVDSCERFKYFSLGSLANFYLGEIHFDRGEYEKSQNYYRKAISLLEVGRLWPSFIKLYKIALTRAKVMKNEKNIDLESLYAYEAENKINIFEGWMQICIGEIVLNIDSLHMNEAEEWIKKAIESDIRNGMMWYLGRDHALYAELFKRKGNKSKAKENLKEAIEIMKECGADGWVAKYEKVLAAL